MNRGKQHSERRQRVLIASWRRLTHSPSLHRWNRAILHPDAGMCALGSSFLCQTFLHPVFVLLGFVLLSPHTPPPCVHDEICGPAQPQIPGGPQQTASRNVLRALPFSLTLRARLRGGGGKRVKESLAKEKGRANRRQADGESGSAAGASSSTSFLCICVSFLCLIV